MPASDLGRIVAALRRSPVYVAPSLAPALPDRRGLLAAIKSAPVPVFVTLVPLAAGGEWPDAEHLSGAVHGRLRRDGVYLALDPTNELVATEFGVDRDSFEAAGAVNLDPAMDSASLADRLTRCVELITSGGAHAAYKKQTDALDAQIRDDRRGQPQQHGGPVPYAVGGGGAVVVVAAVAGLLVWRRRRMRRMRRPRPVVTEARSFDELREHAEAELVSLAEMLAKADPARPAQAADGRPAQADGGRPKKADDRPGKTGSGRPEKANSRRTAKADGGRLGKADGGERLAEALDAYGAAAKALDAARTVPDLAGVLVLIDMGRDLAEHPRRALTPLCFFNPLHGDGPVAVRWRAVGGRERVNVRACAACARAVRGHEVPDVLRDGATPYYEADPARSVWATTGYGQLRGDLVQRVLRGDLRRT